MAEKPLGSAPGGFSFPLLDSVSRRHLDIKE
jgi:hypothetical protein